MFIDIGHYNRDLSAYKPLVQHINSLDMEVVETIRDNIMEMNQNRTPTHYIKEYAVFEHLGRGAFGSVYKVRKRVGQTFVALKEVSVHTVLVFSLLKCMLNKDHTTFGVPMCMLNKEFSISKYREM